MKKTIWQKVDRRIGRLKIFRNSVVFHKNTIKNDPWRDGTTVVKTRTFEIQCPEPQNVSTKLIDDKLVFAGDLSITLNYLDLKKLAQSVTPNLVWSELCAVFTPGDDEMQFHGVTYSIRSVIPQDWQNDQPGQYLVILSRLGNGR